MGILDYSAQHPWLSDALATISQGLLSYGSGNPNAMAQLPQYLAERQRYRRDDQRQAKLDERQNQLFQMQLEEQQRTKNKEAAQKQAAMGLLGTQTPNGMSQAQFGGAPTSGGLLGSFDPPVQDYIKTLVNSGDYGSAIDVYGKLATAKPEADKLKDRYINVGGSLIDLNNPTSPVYVDPKEPKAPRDSWEPYKDPATGMTGQRNTATGKIDWDPGQTGGIQVDTNGDGQPDIVVGGKGMKPPSESQAKAANQATMLDEALSRNETLLSKGGINPLRMAGADTISQYGPLGQLGAQTLLSPQEKQFQASRAAALETLANMITGAAFTEEQKRNFTQMLPQATDDAATSKAKLKSLRRSLDQLKKNAGSALMPPAEDPDLKSKYGLE